MPSIEEYSGAFAAPPQKVATTSDYLDAFKTVARPFTDKTRAALRGDYLPADTNRSGSIDPIEGALEIGRQLKWGATADLPRMLGDAMKYVSEPGQSFYDTGLGITDWVDQQERENPEMMTKYAWKKNPVLHVLAGGARMIPQSIGPPMLLAGIAAGFVYL